MNDTGRISIGWWRHNLDLQEELMRRQGSLPMTFATSATTTAGGHELLTFIAQLRELYLRSGDA